MLRFLHARVAMHSLNFPSFILRRSTYRGRPGVCTHLRSPLPSPTLRAWLISQICLFACSPSDHPPAQLARLSLYCLQHLMPSTETSKWLLSLKVCMPTQMNKKNKNKMYRAGAALDARFALGNIRLDGIAVLWGLNVRRVIYSEGQALTQ